MTETRRPLIHRVLLLLLVIAAARLCLGPPFGSWLPVAEAQVADAGKQRLELLQEARRSNALLTEIRDLLKAQQAAPGKADGAPAGGGGDER